ncbi:MAG: sortase, partial [Clostridia bacterium]|nr:sortase [Clostridia bacterium]
MKKLPAYFIVPVIFAVLGYGVLRVALTPVWELGMAAASMMLLEDAPNFYPELTTTYDPDALKAAKTEEKWINAADVTLPRHGEHYGKLMCERIGLSAPVYWGDENRILRSGAGQYEISSLPGFGEPIIICAHNTTFFRPLQKAEKDDVIVFDTNYDTYRYQVT